MFRIAAFQQVQDLPSVALALHLGRHRQIEQVKHILPSKEVGHSCQVVFLIEG